MDELDLTKEERDYWHEHLAEALGDNYDFDVSDRKLDECCKGWPRAPRDFIQRVQRKFFYKPPDKSKKKEPTEIVQSEHSDDPVYLRLEHDEQVYWNKRYKEYIEEFALNASSDISVLRQVIFEEIIQNRCMQDRLDGKRTDIDKLLSDSSERLNKALSALGINRAKRKDVLEKQGGDIATLSVALDAKIEKRRLENIAWDKEEKMYLEKKAERPPINILPPLDSIESDDFTVMDLDMEIIKESQEKKKYDDEGKNAPITLPTGEGV